MRWVELGVVLTTAWVVACGEGSGACDVGGEGCACTAGGGCDPGLQCLEQVCRAVDGPDPTSVGDGSSDAADEDDDMPSVNLDMGPDASTGEPPLQGCRAIDMLVVLDGSASMIEERSALAVTDAAARIVETLAGLNGGGIEYRIGVTDDNDHGFLTPVAWNGDHPWFDANVLPTDTLAIAFGGAVQSVDGLGGASLGCEHVLTSGVDLLRNDDSGFVRPDALLLLVLLTDVDDYGAYDQLGGHTCGDLLGGCTTPPPVLEDLVDDLVALKGGDPTAVAAIVIAGDPNVQAGVNLCDQPGSCGCNGTDCQVFHGERLFAFSQALGDNGVFANLCEVGSSVPTAIEDALNERIDLACTSWVPPG